MEGVLLPACSVFFSIFLLVVFFCKERVNLLENHLYGIMLITSVIDSILVTILQAITTDGVNSFDEFLIDNLNKIDFMVLILFMMCLFLYTAVISFEKLKVNFHKFKKYFIFLFIVLSIVALILDIDLIEKNGNYSIAGYGVIFTYVVSGVFLFASVGVALSKFKTRDKRYIPMFAIMFIILLLFLLFSINPYLIIISITITFLNFLMYHTIENPDVKMIRQLEIARDAADKANAAKTDFLSSMSHEIRTPLNAIVGFSDCIKNSNDLEEAKENADDIINASNTLLEIVNGILDISKIEAGKLEIINSDYNANNLFSGLAKLITPKMNEKGLDFQVTIAPDLPTVLYGDSANIKKVVTNLLSNAYKYTDSGFVKYDVKCVNTNGVCRLIVTVSDSGRGIKKESIDKLFTKFQRVDEDRNTTIEGTGLGLAITKQLIELMGGTIVVDSTFGEGSKFTITLDQRIDNVVIVEEKSVSDNIDLTGRKILVVDDNAINLKVARKLLERYNATVEVCDSGFKCVELINSGANFDLILMDDMMPKMSGTQTLQKLKENSSFSIPVFALTANAITGMKEKYLEAGFDSYLAKPIEKEALINEFNKLFKEKTSIVEEKKEEVVEEQIEVKEESTNDVVKNTEYLKSNNIDVDHGLELLGDMDLYNDTMNDFIDEVIKRLPLLDEYKNNSDMPNYAILVHAIKSDCKYLGIMSLADLNYEHELKSKANDIDFVNNNYDNLISEINKYLDVCKKYMGRD